MTGNINGNLQKEYRDRGLMPPPTDDSEQSFRHWIYNTFLHLYGGQTETMEIVKRISEKGCQNAPEHRRIATLVGQWQREREMNDAVKDWWSGKSALVKKTLAILGGLTAVSATTYYIIGVLSLLGVV